MLEKLQINSHFSSNQLENMDANSFTSILRVQKLWLDENRLREVPMTALRPLIRLEALNLASNMIEVVSDFAFETLQRLIVLILHNNMIETVGVKAFQGLISLKVLELNSNRLMKLPEAIASLPMLGELTFSDNMIQFLEGNTFQYNPKLIFLEMSGNPITATAKNTFAKLPHLKKLILSEARMLSEFPDLTDTSSLEHLRLDRANLKAVPQNLCEMVPLLRSLNLKSNEIGELPKLNGCTHLRLLDLSYNFITLLEDEQFAFQSMLIDLFLGHNQIDIITPDTFKGLENLQVLDLESNNIQDIHEEAFKHFKDLRDLNLAGNHFPHLPTRGLQNLRELKTYNNRELKDFPPTESFPRINRLALSYAYHCCEFIAAANIKGYPSKATSPLQETIVWLSKDDVDMASWHANMSDVWPGYDNFSSKFEDFANQLWKTVGRDYPLPDNFAQYAEEYFESSFGGEDHGANQRYTIQCLPEPGPFMPCTDLFGWWSLRCGIWVVFLLALLGNGVVVIVLLVGRSKMDVPRFLVCNLAGADFFMGIYLGMLAVVDASTLGEFKVSAIRWQTSAGCQIAGFLGVLSSELSVFTLSVITLERNYAITHAMHLNKRLSLRHASYIMFGGWTFAGIMATLPLFGISDYRKFAICLPFETEDVMSLSYVVFLILINGVAFLILMGCYLKMYCAIRGSQAWNSNDSRIARRMALLVFTDFICWAPIAFYSLNAVCGVYLISLEEAKVFAIFVLPLNSCANPFLYAIFTKQFKKDCIHICKRIEESRVTRGIGRGRHSSNFSNRHTPITTNSGAGVVAAPAGSTSDPLQQPQERMYNSEYGVCTCGTAWKQTEEPHRDWRTRALRYLFCQSKEPKENTPDRYSYAITQIRRSLERRHKHASSISSENFSSRSDSWRQGNVPLRLMDQVAHRGSKTYQRKSSQDSNISCSRQDSSTSTFRLSRSSFSTDSSVQHKPSCSSRVPNDRECHLTVGRDGKPKLCRQTAVEESQNRRKDPVNDLNKLNGNDKQRERICAFCTAKTMSSPSIAFKSKDIEQKFTCFYNRLAESSHEESSNAFSSKEDQLISVTEGQSKELKLKTPAAQDFAMCDIQTKDLFIDTSQVKWSQSDIILTMDGKHEPLVSNYWLASPINYLENSQGHTSSYRNSRAQTGKCSSLTGLDQANELHADNQKSADDSSKFLVMSGVSEIISRSYSSQTLQNDRIKYKLPMPVNSGSNSQAIKSSRSENIVHECLKEVGKSYNPLLLQLRYSSESPSTSWVKHGAIDGNKQKPRKIMKSSLSAPNITSNKKETLPLIDKEES